MDHLELINTNPLISIIIPIYKVDKYLNKCIDSVINQTYKHLEIILVDDGSSDDCGILCDEYVKKDNRISIVHKNNGGLSNARNTGLDIAVGDYITFIDGDDWYDKKAIETLLNIAKTEKADILCMKNVTTNDYKKCINHDETFITEHISNNTFIEKICNNKMSTSVCNKLFSSTLLENIRFKKDTLNEDFLFLGKIILNNDTKIVCTNFVGYYYFKRDNSITRSENIAIKSVYDSIDNSIELMKESIKNKKEFKKHFSRIALYQTRTLLIIMPMKEIKKNSKCIIQIDTCLKECGKDILYSSLKLTDKLILMLARVNPLITSRLLHIIYKK